MLRRLLIFLFYCLFVGGAIGVCLVLLFPRDKFLGWVSNYIEQKLPGVEISVGDIKYVHPLKIRLYELKIEDDAKQWELPVNTLLISFEPSYPVERIGIIGVVFGGDLSFDLSLTKKDRIELVDLKISEMHLADLKIVERSMDRPVKGIVSLEGRASVDKRRLQDVRFIGKLRIESFYTPLRLPVLNQAEVRFDRVSADLVLNTTMVDVTDGTAVGPLFAGDFSGQIRGTVPLSSSGIDFNGNLVPQPALLEDQPALAEPLKAYFTRYRTDSIPFWIEGTVAEPLFDFENLN